METLSDQSPRARALDTSESFIVQAPAGSGKTGLLVRRYLSLLVQVDAPERILAITFTRKARAEMRRRIVRALQQTDDGGDDELRALADAARAADARHGWRITEDARRLRIQTIDSFCTELVRRMPWSARFGAPPEIIDDAEPLHQRAAQRALDHIDANDEWSDACRRLLALVDADWSRAQSLLATMLAKRDKWLRLLQPATREDAQRMWREVIDAELHRAKDLIADDERAQWLELGRHAAANLHAEGIDSAVVALCDADGFPRASHECIGEWRALAALVLTQAGAFRKQVDKRSGFPPSDRAMKDAMHALLARLHGRDGLLAALQAVTRLPDGAFDDAQWATLDALMRVLRLAAAELLAVFAERNQADFIELTRRAETALGDADAPSDLALAFDYRIAHILMDEFQDTSIAHIQLIVQLTAGWMRGDGRTLFLVGDPMQSIYRFREAEVANFLKVRRDGLSDDLHPQGLELRTNFRSTPALVAWFNRAFAQVLPQRDDPINGAVRYAEAVAHLNADSGGARFDIGVGRSAAREAADIAALIARAQQADPNQTIAVLGRTRAHLHRIAEALRGNGIAFAAINLERLAERAAVRDLTALTRALSRDGDRIAWLALLRAPWCGLRLDDLHAIGADPRATIIERCDDARVIESLSDDGRARLARFTAAIADARDRRGRVGLRRNVEAAWLALGGPACVNADDLGDCQRYLDLLGELEAKRIEITADNLRRACADLWAASAVDSKVQLLTIHGAKGLEFDTVILPSLGSAGRSGERDLLQWKEFPDQLLFAPRPPSDDARSKFYSYLESLDAIQQRNELARLLYVACTRARRELHLFAAVQREAKIGDAEPRARAPRADSFLHLLWTLDEVRAACNAAVAAVDDEAAGAESESESESPSRALQRLPLAWQPPELPTIAAPTAAADDGDEDAIEFDWAGENARVIGIVLHTIFQRIDAIGWERWRAQEIDAQQEASWRAKLAEGGIAADAMDESLARVRDAVIATRDDERAAWIFSADHQRIKTEWPLAVAEVGKIAHVVIDRSFIADGVRWIIDFKTGGHLGGDEKAHLDQERERYAPQMARYASAVGALDPSDEREIRLGLYFPALRGWREWSARG